MPYFHGKFCLRVTILKGKMAILGVKIIISRGKMITWEAKAQ